MKISVLDHSPIRAGQPHDAPIRESIALAQSCERAGYHRYWVSEHHASESVAGSAPEILMAAIAATTSTIRIGSAGIMLPHYSALKVAEQFRVLEAIAPGRIDLGVGRAPGSDGRTALALNPNFSANTEAFPSTLRDLQAWSSGSPLPENHPFRMVRAGPAGPFAPQIWVLGSSDYGAQVAAFFGLPYCYAYFFSEGRGAARALDVYRQNYRPSELNPQPHAAIAAFALAAETQEAADYHYLPRTIQGAMYLRGQFIPLPSPESAANFELTDAERLHIQQRRDKAFFGTPTDVASRLTAEGRSLGIDELVLVTSAYDPLARQQSYSLLAREFGLQSA
jgi:luciferase family oxidoreductase group 1